ncbi:Hsp70 family protein [Phytohabitans suffuscus]|uniref:Chaperone DnaJ C-terminal domain-containing protein n=1 Tax=Phytohabitans suffuscus TaxID=624315 RepID=A0A6F8YVH5_9ACTN|nr:hypothetical protein Psuf_072510 [Phytohabitans suffuscus]
MTSIAPGLAIDFGTSHTVAVLARDGGRFEPLLFGASPLLPSAVFAAADGRLLVGHDADRSARVDPARYEPNPKRRLDDGALLLGDAEVAVVDACAAVLGRVREEAARTLGGALPRRTVLTCPAGWGAPRRGLLTAAAGAAGLTGIELVSEPVAAAAYYTRVLGHRMRDGDAIVVYDFGGGTFDVSVVRRTGDHTWETAAADGLDDVGGIDLDAAVVDWARRTVQPDHPAWRRLRAPRTVAERRHRRHLWEDARAAKEQLSRGTTAGLAVPMLDVDTHLTRAEFEAIARPWLDRTVRLTRDTIRGSKVPVDRLAGVFLVGGASRTPLVATLLHQALRRAPVAIEQPELVVAHGGLVALSAPAPSPPPGAPPPSSSSHTWSVHTGSSPGSSQTWAQASSSTGPFDWSAFDNLFAGFGFTTFGPGQNQGVRRVGRHYETDVVLTRAQVRHGVVELHLDWPIPCAVCRGTGIDRRAGHGHPCTACGHSGLSGTRTRRTLNVRLPAGVTDGQRVRLAGQGHPSPDGAGPAGDLLITIRIR